MRSRRFGVKGGVAFIAPFELRGQLCVEEFEIQVVLHAFFLPCYKIFIRSFTGAEVRTSGSISATDMTSYALPAFLFFPVRGLGVKPRLQSLPDHPTQALPAVTGQPDAAGGSLNIYHWVGAASALPGASTRVGLCNL